MRKFFAFSIAAVVALGSAACDQQPLGPQEMFEPAMAKVQNDVFKGIGFGFGNGCTGEFGTGEGTLHLQTNITTNANNTSLKGSFKFNGSGVANTGVKYQAKINQSVSLNFDNSDAAPLVITQHVRVSLISQGSGDNLVVDGFAHLTINANGVITSFKLDPITAECRG